MGVGHLECRYPINPYAPPLSDSVKSVATDCVRLNFFGPFEYPTNLNVTREPERVSFFAPNEPRSILAFTCFRNCHLRRLFVFPIIASEIKDLVISECLG